MKASTEKAELPREVFEAFQRIKRSWRNLVSEDDLNLLLLNINLYGTSGDTLILKEFAKEHPTEYIKALANGYKPKTDNINEEVSDMIQEWVNTEYVADEATDALLFAERLTSFYKQKLIKIS